MENIKRVVLVITIICSTQYSYSQFLYGINFGTNYSKISTIASDLSIASYNSKYNSGFQIGATLKYRLSSAWALQSDIQFFMRSGKGDIVYNTIILSDSGVYIPSGKTSSHSSYLRIPLMMQYRIQPANWPMIYANAGIYTGFKQSEFSKSEIWVQPQLFNEEGRPYSGFENDNIYIQDKLLPQKSYSAIDYGFIFGIGTALNLSEDCYGILTPEIRISQSFVNQSSYNKLGACIEFSIGYISSFKKQQEN